MEGKSSVVRCECQRKEKSDEKAKKKQMNDFLFAA
jgi:hypothetical protein